MAASNLQETPLLEELNNKETHISLVEDIEHDSEPGVYFNYDPYPKRTISDLLSRKYLIYQNVAFGGNVFLRPLSLLLEVPQIQRCLQGFKYLRTEVNVEILVTANKNVYGTLLVSSLPFVGHTDNSRSDITRQLQSEPHILDISRQEGLTMHLPWVGLLRYIDLDSTEAPRQWRVQISTMAVESLVTDVAPNVEIEVWANFVKPETALFTDAVFQSMTVSRHPNPLVSMAAAVNALGQYLPSVGSLSNLMPEGAATPAAASVSAASAGLAYHAFKEGFRALKSFEPRGPPDQVKSQVCPDLNGTAGSALNFLGDPVRGAKEDLPTTRNIYDIESIISTPAYLGTYHLSAVTDDFEIECDPDLPGSYFRYFLRMFKYYRTDVKVMIRFATAPDVTAKLAVKVLPSGLASDHYGDLPFWEVSMKGTTDFACVVPYLENTHWKETYQTLQPKLHVSLMRDIPKVYDKTPKIFAHVFLAPVNCRLASLQSPCNPTAQCTFEQAFSDVQTFGRTRQSEFLHSYTNVYELLCRYSSRDVDSALPIFPFPHEINSALYKYDTFDYVAQLYMFYTGSMDVKYLCEGVAPGTLKMVVGNSNYPSVHGNSFRAGNSMSLTSQAVWPVVEINFPFEQLVEFNAVKDPLPSYVPELNLPEAVTEIFLRPGPDFAFFTLGPTPDWADNVEAVFQSSTTRMYNQEIYCGHLTSTNGSWASAPLTAFPSGTCTVVIEGYLKRTSGTTDCNSSVAIGTGTSSTNIYTSVQSSVIGGLIPWIDVTNSGKNFTEFKFSRCLSGYVTSNWVLRFSTDSLTSTFDLYYTVTAVPFAQTVMPISPDSGYCDVVLASGQTVDIAGPVEVSLVQSTITAPIPVHDSGVVDVSLTSIPTTDTLSVTGALTVSNAPLWVTTYRP